MKLPYLLMLALVLLRACPALGVDSPTQSGDSGIDIKWLAIWAGICAALGTLATAIVNVVRWLRERSSAARKLETVSYALKLKEFLDSEKELSGALGVGAESDNAARTARAELRAALAKLDASPRPISKVRRLFLLYAPKGLRAWLAHSLFYAVTIFSFVFLLALCFGDEDLKPTELILAVLVAVPVGVLFARWAALEWRISTNIRLKPKAIGFLSWYPANNRYGFVAQIMLLLGLLQIVTLVIPFPQIDVHSVSIPSPSWQLTIEIVLHAAFLPIGYLWAQTELRYSEEICTRPSWTGFAGRIFRPQTGEQVVGLLAFVVLTLWNLVLLIQFNRIAKDATFPDTEFGQVGLVMATLSHVGTVLIVGWLPWLAVYRGLFALYDDGPELAERSLTAASEERNG